MRAKLAKLQSRTREKKSQPQGQILIVTLFVLMIVAIIIVGVVAVSSRDVLQLVISKRYDEFYDAAERTITGMITKFGSSSTTLSQLLNSSNLPSGYSCATDSVPGQYKCTRGGEPQRINDLFIRDSRDIVEYELGKDEPMTVNLGTYRGEMQISWTGAAALEFGILYYTSDNNYHVLFDYYENVADPVFTSYGGDPLVPNTDTHPFQFQSNPTGGIRFNINTAVGTNNPAYLLRITPRMKGDGGTIRITVKPTGTSGYPNQVRVFEAASYGETYIDPTTGEFQNYDNADIYAAAQAQVLLYPQLPAVFHYGLLTPNLLRKF